MKTFPEQVIKTLSNVRKARTCHSVCIQMVGSKMERNVEQVRIDRVWKNF